MKTKTLTCLAALLPVLLFLYACGDCSRKIDCPGFSDDTLTKLFPYTDNQRLVFRSDTGSLDVFTLKNTSTSEPYQATGGPYGRQPVCTETKVFESLERDSSNRSHFRLLLQSGNFQEASISIRSNSIDFKTFSDTSFVYVNINYLQAPPVSRQAVTIGNRSFTNVIVAQRDTSNSKRIGIYRIFYTRADGIVAYTNYPSGINWVKQ